MVNETLGYLTDTPLFVRAPPPPPPPPPLPILFVSYLKKIENCRHSFKSFANQIILDLSSFFLSFFFFFFFFLRGRGGGGGGKGE